MHVAYIVLRQSEMIICKWKADRIEYVHYNIEIGQR